MEESKAPRTRASAKARAADVDDSNAVKTYASQRDNTTTRKHGMMRLSSSSLGVVAAMLCCFVCV